jgi:seryl-tRNA(Sec) selenium transferase
MLLALDQGTTSTRTILHGPDLAPLASEQVALAQHYPAPGWVEHEPEEIWSATLATLRGALAKGGVAARDVAGIGITNQRETVVVWDRASGRAIHRAIVWQDRRTAEACARLEAEGAAALVTERTGLLCDPYFSATKLAWLLDNVAGAREAAERGSLAFGTVDSFLLWRLTGGRVHATDATNACRTMLFDIRRGEWDEELLKLFRIPRGLLPEVRDCAAEFGTTDPALLGAAVPVRGIAGDQHAATLGQACFAPGMVKSTYGTGCFALLNTGDTPVPSRNRLLTTLAWQLGGRRTYALEGAIFVAGAAVQWLRDGLGCSATRRRAGSSRRMPTRRRGGVRAGLRRPRRAVLGRGGARRHPRPDARHRPGRDRPRRRWRAWPSRPATWWRRWRPTGTRPAARRGCCAWMAAWSPPTGRCSSWPTCSARRSTGRRCGRRRRWVPPTSPGCRPGCCRRPGRRAPLAAGAPLRAPDGTARGGPALCGVEGRGAPGPHEMSGRPDSDLRAALFGHRDAGIYEALGVSVIINAAGTSTRLSGGMMAPEVAAAMAEAATACVEMPDLQAAASRVIAEVTGAEAGVVTCGAAAALLLGAAACRARLDPVAMDALPGGTAPDEFVMARGQRNMYDRALRVAGARIVEVGIPDRFSGAGVRDATASEIAAAIGTRTAGVLWVAQPWSEPELREVSRVARAAGVPVLVDAAAQLPPSANLRRFVAEGADLVCFSGGKAIGGPQASGILAGRRDLVASALLQMLDLDLPEAQFRLPAEFAEQVALPFLPQHGIGRACKAGKEEIVGLLVALLRFAAEGCGPRAVRLRARLGGGAGAMGETPGEIAEGPVPLLLLPAARRGAAQGGRCALRPAARHPCQPGQAARRRAGGEPAGARRAGPRPARRRAAGGAQPLRNGRSGRH